MLLLLGCLEFGPVDCPVRIHSGLKRKFRLGELDAIADRALVRFISMQKIAADDGSGVARGQ